MKLFSSRNFKGVLLALVLFALPSGTARAQDHSLEIAVNRSSPPFSYLEDGKLKGIFIDLIREIVERRMGVQVEFYAYTWEGAQRQVKLGRRDGMVTNATPARLEYATASAELVYLTPLSPLAKIGSQAGVELSDVPKIKTLRELKFCHGQASGWHAWFTKQNDIDSFSVTDSKACIKMINKGRMDVIVYSTDMMLWDVRTLGLQNDVEVLPVSFGEWRFKLLISKLSNFGDTFIENFDQILVEMNSDGSYEKLVQSFAEKYR